MVDLLAHVLVGYAGATLLACRGRLARRHVPVAMVGAALPDLSKMGMVVPEEWVEHLFGLPFTWLAFHRLGGILLLAGAGALAFGRGERVGAYGVLVGSAAVHLLLDALVARAGGYAPPYLYPFTWWQPPAGGLYVSSDLWPTAVAVALAAAAWLLPRRRSGATPGASGRRRENSHDLDRKRRGGRDRSAGGDSGGRSGR